jgi:hypothetical protein
MPLARAKALVASMVLVEHDDGSEPESEAQRESRREATDRARAFLEGARAQGKTLCISGNNKAARGKAARGEAARRKSADGAEGNAARDLAPEAQP